MRTKCRIWWPKQAVSHEPSSYSVLFGWLISTSLESLDVVVAFMSSDVTLSSNLSQIMEDLHRTNARMPSFLQDETTFRSLGLLLADSKGIMPSSKVILNNEKATLTCRNSRHQNGEDALEENHGLYNCNCDVTNEALMRSLSLGDCKWVKLVYDSQGNFHGATHLIPELHHIHWDSEIICSCDVHDTTIHAINCAAAAISIYHRSVTSKRYIKIQRTVAFTVASCFTLLYIMLQLFHGLLDCAAHWKIHAMPAKNFHVTGRSISIWCSQFLYWPVYLGEESFRFHSSVEFAEKAALHRHSLWTSMIVDLLLGNATGLAFLFRMEIVRLWVFAVVSDITNSILRSGCVWLMGVPAGFKLNTELATVLGMVSLNTIQNWPTFWFSVGLIFEHILRGTAVLGMVFGISTAAAFIRDMTELAAFHVRALHWILSLIYSWQIQSIASLWRLFRGQKWNPLRQRLDNFDYTVEQHVVGSLLFTPLLLLLPTTSVFYIFFSIVSACISSLCLLTEFIMSLVRATPYLKILLWIVNPRRFPSGIWFEVKSSRNNHLSRLMDDQHISTISKSSVMLPKRRDDASHFIALVSNLRSNCLSFGEIVLPHYRHAFSGVSPSFFASAARGIFTGQRFPMTLGASFPAKRPWYFISPKEYWQLCYDSIVAPDKEDGLG